MELLRPRTRGDRGAVVPIVAVMMTLLIVIASFAVDLGMLRVVRRDMQTLSDVVALDLSRLVDGRTAAKILDGSGTGSQARPTLEDAKTRSVARNMGSTVGSRPTVTVTLAFTNADGSISRASDGSIVPVPRTAVPQAVVVTARSKLDFAFSPGTGTVQRTAVGANQEAACFELGSYVAAVRVDAGLVPVLNSLTGLSLSAGAVGYQGLLDTSLSIAQLANTTVLGSPDGVLTAPISYRNLILASIEVLQRNPNNDPTTQVNGAVAQLNAVLTTSTGLSQSFKLGDALGISTVSDAALATRLSLLNIITAGAALADGKDAVALPVGATTGIASVTSTLKAVEGRKLGCGLVAPTPPPTTCPAVGSGDQTACATSSQLSGVVTAALTPIALSVVGVSSTAITGTSVINVGLGNATGVLTAPDPVCASGTTTDPDLETVRVSSALGILDTTTSLHVVAQVQLPIGLLGALVSTRVEFDLPVTASTPSTPDATANLKVPPNDVTPITTGSINRLGVPTVGAASNLTVNGAASAAVLGTTVALVNSLVVGPVTSAVTSTVVPTVLAPFVAAVNSTVLTPVRELLGLDVGGVDVYATGRPTCQSPELVG